jgi:hypothetical protein
VAKRKTGTYLWHGSYGKRKVDFYLLAEAAALCRILRSSLGLPQFTAVLADRTRRLWRLAVVHANFEVQQSAKVIQLAWTWLDEVKVDNDDVAVAVQQQVLKLQVAMGNTLSYKLLVKMR